MLAESYEQNPRAEGIVEIEWHLQESLTYLMMCIILTGSKVTRYI